MFARHLILIVGLGTLCLAGCLSPVRQDVDDLVCRRAELTLDPPTPEYLQGPDKRYPPPPEKKKPANLLERLKVPEYVPGSDAKEMTFDLPKNFLKLPPEKQEALMAPIVAKYFPPLMEVGPDPKPAPGPNGQPLTLGDLQRLAREHSPLLREAASNIQAAQGAMIQAGVYNNPVLGYSSSAESFTNGSIMGPSISQTIVTMGKRKLAQTAARMDLAMARLAYRRAETDLMASVRSAYFAVLVNEEGMKANRALIELTDEVYKVIIIQLKKGQVAGYEPAQVAVYANQARIAYIQSRNSYLQSWKNLATAIGLNLMPATELSGSVTQYLPRFDFDKSLDYVLRNHTDARTALIGIEKARHLLRLAQVTPVPDVTVGASFIYDATPGLSGNSTNRMVPGVTASVPLSIFDRNQGGIQQAQGALLFAVEEPHRVQNALTASFVDAFRRLEENRQILEIYHKQLLPQQIQAFRATVKRHFVIGPVEVSLAGSSTSYLTDLIAAEQNVVSTVGSYLTNLGAYWQAASDTASLLQTDDVYDMATAVTNLPPADLTQLLSLPCCHPCSSVPVAPGVQPAAGAPVDPALPVMPGAVQRDSTGAGVSALAGMQVVPGQPAPPLPISRGALLGAPTLNPENQTDERFEGGTR